jgi:hypothetical protein
MIFPIVLSINTIISCLMFYNEICNYEQPQFIIFLVMIEHVTMPIFILIDNNYKIFTQFCSLIMFINFWIIIMYYGSTQTNLTYAFMAVSTLISLLSFDKKKVNSTCP